jgi:predicted DNA-binding protein YlxM (UPF0122 family)
MGMITLFSDDEGDILDRPLTDKELAVQQSIEISAMYRNIKKLEKSLLEKESQLTDYAEKVAALYLFINEQFGIKQNGD